MSPAVSKVLTFLEGLIARSFFGKVTITFQSGKICEIKTEQTRKLEEL